MTYLPFARQSATEEYNGERLVNYFLRQAEGVSQAVLIARSGLSSIASPGSEVVAMIEMGGNIYSISDGVVWKYDVSTSQISNVGTVKNSDVVSLAENGQQIAIITDGTYYICDGTTTTQYATGAVSNPQWVVHVDGYFMVSGTASGRDDAITVSSIRDGTVFNLLDFAFAENAPDAIRGLAVLSTRVWAFGATTTEKFYNSPSGTNFPFIPSKSEVMDKGILNGQCWAELDNSIFWVGQNKIVYRSSGGVAQVISTPEVKESLDVSEIKACFSFFDRGHEFFAVRRTEKTTLCYDVTTGLWSERSSGLQYGPWIVSAVAELGGVQYYGTDTGYLATSSRSTHTDIGSVIMCEATSVPVENGDELFSVDAINLRAVTPDVYATGTTAGQISLRTSGDGVEWSDEILRDLGAPGEYNKRIHWEALGTFDRAQMRLRVTDPVQRDLFGVSYSVS